MSGLSIDFVIFNYLSVGFEMKYYLLLVLLNEVRFISMTIEITLRITIIYS
jgi:hypothetical protein